MDPWLDIVADNIKALKKARDWSQDKLAEEAGCSKSVVRDLEAKRGSASVEMLGRIAEALGVGLGELFSDGSPARVVGIHRAVLAIPEEVYELAQRLPLNSEAWESVKGALSGEIKALERRALAKKKG